MSQFKVSSAREILDKFYAAEKELTSASPESRDISKLTSLLSDDFTLDQPSGLPWSGMYHGPNGLVEWMTRASEWIQIDVRDSRIFESPDDPHTIVVLSETNYTCHKTGVKNTYPLSQTMGFDLEKGLITSIRGYIWDCCQMIADMGYTKE